MARELSQTEVEVELPDGTTVHGFAAAQAQGFAFDCQWFAGCDAAAVTAVSHPILTAVPCCRRHADFALGD